MKYICKNVDESQNHYSERKKPDKRKTWSMNLFIENQMQINLKIKERLMGTWRWKWTES
jgi:hypothetical protein